MMFALTGNILQLRSQNQDLHRQLSAALTRALPSATTPPPNAEARDETEYAAETTEKMPPPATPRTSQQSPPPRTPPNPSMDADIDKVNAQISEIQTRLRNLTQDTRALNRNSLEYDRQHAVTATNQQIALQQQMQDLEGQAVALQARVQELAEADMDPRDRDRQRTELEAQIGALRDRRRQLQDQASVTDATAQSQALAAAQEAERERSQVVRERESMERQLSELQKNLKALQAQKEGKAPP